MSKGRNVLLRDSLQITAIRLQPALCDETPFPLLRPKYNIFKFSKRPFLIASVKIRTNSSAFSAMVGLSTSQVVFSPTEERENGERFREGRVHDAAHDFRLQIIVYLRITSHIDCPSTASAAAATRLRRRRTP